VRKPRFFSDFCWIFDFQRNRLPLAPSGIFSSTAASASRLRSAMRALRVLALLALAALPLARASGTIYNHQHK
jgi:hypothetical protein